MKKNNSQSDASYAGDCVECGKAVRKPFFYLGKGPYGKCCYKKLFGDVPVFSVRRIKIGENRKEKVCGLGVIKDCTNCVLWKACTLDEREDRNVAGN